MRRLDKLGEPRSECERVILSNAFITIFPNFAVTAMLLSFGAKWSVEGSFLPWKKVTTYAHTRHLSRNPWHPITVELDPHIDTVVAVQSRVPVLWERNVTIAATASESSQILRNNDWWMWTVLEPVEQFLPLGFLVYYEMCWNRQTWADVHGFMAMSCGLVPKQSRPSKHLINSINLAVWISVQPTCRLLCQVRGFEGSSVQS